MEEDSRPRRGRAPKRAAILDAARRVFGRDGYSRTSIDAIAGEAAVSTRTIYNHFEGKEQLFAVVLKSSATQVAETFETTLRSELGDEPSSATRLEADLVVIGRALLRQSLDHPEHFAMIRQITAEAPHFPDAVLRDWRDAGPLRVRRAVADRLAAFARQGLLREVEPFRAAGHLVALTSAELTSQYRPWGDPPTDAEVDDALRAGVAAFLHGYVSDPTPTGAAPSD
ncbi:TetR/AcrR family transcriptional regulator [Pseudonocardia spinosispora]|uniref:TetR/AcrR family transcriptional regulator n=1 Tax=Pseudonocardia spinosispora TaxID=103441 RepID=UPI00042641B9|nr:TetR/AcrR family transcriptional regulator [Pseudonocardia spinosispora]